MGNTTHKGASLVFTKEEIHTLYLKFKALDAKKTGKLELEEFFKVPEVSENPLAERVIKIFDKNRDNKISFSEFVQGISSLHSESSDEEKIKFAFKIYDIDEDGYISNGDLFQALRIMVGDTINDVNLQQLVDRTIIKADKDMDGMVSYPEFKEVVQSFDFGSRFNLESFSVTN